MTTTWRQIRAAAIERGAPIGIVSPSGPPIKKIFSQGRLALADWGYQPHVHAYALSRRGFLAGSDLQRSASLLDFAATKAVKAIWATRGGYGITRILPILEQEKFCEKLRKDPKLLLGYSDFTALHIFVWNKLNLPTVHAPTIAGHNFFTLSKKAKKNFEQLMNGSMPLNDESYSCDWKTSWLIKPSTAIKGIMLGGNLCMLTTLCGTRWQPDFRGKILFLEEVNEPPYRIDRMLTQLWQCGVLGKVKAVVLGDMDIGVPPSDQKPWSVMRTTYERLKEYGIPTLKGIPVGHSRRNEPLPLGVKVQLTNKGKLEFLEQVVKSP